MKKILENSKRSAAAIMTLCILLCIAATGVYAVSVMPEETTTTEDTSTVNEETSQELVPVMAQRCGNACTHDDMVFDHSENDGTILVFVCDRCGQYIRQKAG